MSTSDDVVVGYNRSMYNIKEVEVADRCVTKSTGSYTMVTILENYYEIRLMTTIIPYLAILTTTA